VARSISKGFGNHSFVHLLYTLQVSTPFNNYRIPLSQARNLALVFHLDSAIFPLLEDEPEKYVSSTAIDLLIPGGILTSFVETKSTLFKPKRHSHLNNRDRFHTTEGATSCSESTHHSAEADHQKPRGDFSRSQSLYYQDFNRMYMDCPSFPRTGSRFVSSRDSRNNQKSCHEDEARLLTHNYQTLRQSYNRESAAARHFSTFDRTSPVRHQYGFGPNQIYPSYKNDIFTSPHRLNNYQMHFAPTRQPLAYSSNPDPGNHPAPQKTLSSSPKDVMLSSISDIHCTSNLQSPSNTAEQLQLPHLHDIVSVSSLGRTNPSYNDSLCSDTRIAHHTRTQAS
jgi:hypothetical protein